MSEFLNCFLHQVQATPDAILMHHCSKDYSAKDLYEIASEVSYDWPQSVQTIGLMASSGPHWAAGLLAVEAAGRTLVSLPDFFSCEQLAHVVKTAAIEHLLCSAEQVPLAQRFQIPYTVIGRKGSGSLDISNGAKARQIVFTSGSSGQPKGVVLGVKQLDHQSKALADASGASKADHHLSVLPYAQLLEQVCGLRIPLMLGARVTVVPEAFGGALSGDFIPLIQAMRDYHPTTSVLVPEMLRGLVGTAAVMKLPGFTGLRYVAVGGSHTPLSLAEAAWRLGIPVHEGYGLTEAGSVVAVNAYGQRKAGTVGRPLAGSRVAIRNGEIQVESPALMEGYLGRAPQGPTLSTGDLGHLDEEGCLIVQGRRDNLLNSGMGRSLSPEWVESTLMNSSKIAHCGLVLDAKQRPALILCPSPRGKALDASDWCSEVSQFSASLPVYARPQTIAISSLDALIQQGAMTANGKWQRKHLRALSRQMVFQEI